MILDVRNVSHWFGANKVLNQVHFQIAAGQIVAVVGPSGCGKSTLLRAILGTDPPKQGEIEAMGHRVVKPSRHIGIVYQRYSLYDFLTARENVAFGLMLDQSSIAFRCCKPLAWKAMRKRHLSEAEQLLEKVALADAMHLYPREMSGGMRQRVAIAQALIMKPKILLLDEPFGALDEATREELQLMLLQLYKVNRDARQQGRRPPFTILLVTHELNEAIYVSDRILGLSQYHEDGANGATIVYDKPAPVFAPEDHRDFLQFTRQKDELRKAVFDPATRQPARQYVSFWPEAEEPDSGDGTDK